MHYKIYKIVAEQAKQFPLKNYLLAYPTELAAASAISHSLPLLFHFIACGKNVSFITVQDSQGAGSLVFIL